MGLDCSHDAFRGSYSAFNRLRQAVAKAAGGSFPPHEGSSFFDDLSWYVSDEYTRENSPGLFEFLSHSDCDGEISPEMCINVADELSQLHSIVDDMGEGTGHISRRGYGGTLQRFIDGCRLAAKNNECLTFE